MKYDCIIIGAGISGVIAANILQSKGYRVLVLEKEERAGGHFSGYTNEFGDKFDYAVSYVLSCGKDDVVTNCLKDLGLDKEIVFKKLNLTDEIYIGDKHVCFGEGKEEFKKVLIEAFPENEKEIEDLSDWLSLYLEGVETQGKEAINFFISNFRKNYEDFLIEKISNSELRNILSMKIQANPSSLMIMAGFLVESYFKGMYYPEGGTYVFVTKLMNNFQRNGGEVIYGSEIVDYKTQNKKIISVIDIHGNEYEAEVFIHNGDIIKLDQKLLESCDEYKGNNQIKGRVIGHSSLDIYLTLKEYDVSKFKGGRIYYTETENIFDTYRELEDGYIPEKPVIKVHIPTSHDSTLADKDRILMRVETDIVYNPSLYKSEDYLRLADQMLEKLNTTILPGFLEKVVYKRIILPEEFAKMFGHTNGSGTGWAHTTHNMMVSKFSQSTSIENLFIAGQWGEFGSGLRQLVLSGEKAVKNVEHVLGKGTENL